MKLSDAKQLARKLMDEHGANDVPLIISGGKRQLGVCSFKAKANPTLDIVNDILGYRRPNRKERLKNAICVGIKLSRYLVDLNDENEIRETILHEIAHFLVGPVHGHDAVWSKKAIEIGCNGNTYTKTAKMPEGRYKAVCDCGKVYTKHRKGKNVLKANHWRCGICKKSIRFYDTQTKTYA